MKIINGLLEEVISGQISFSRIRQLIKIVDKKPDQFLWRTRDTADSFKPALLPHDIDLLKTKLTPFMNTLRASKAAERAKKFGIPHFSTAKIVSIRFVGVHQIRFIDDIATLAVHRPIFQIFYKDNKAGAFFLSGKTIELIRIAATVDGKPIYDFIKP